MTKNRALAWLVEHAPVTVTGYPELAKVFGWQRTKCWRVIGQWRRNGWLETETAPDTGRLTVSIIPNAIPIAVADSVEDEDEDDGSPTFRGGTSPFSDATDARSHRSVQPANEQGVPDERHGTELAEQVAHARYVDRPREGAAPADALDWMARLIAVGVACITAYFSIHGLLTLFPGDEIGVTVFGIGVEALKVGGVMYLSKHASTIWWLWRWLAIVAIIIAAGLNSASVYAKFASLHSRSPAAAAATREASAAELDARIEQHQRTVNDLTRRAAVIDDTMDNVNKKANAKGATKTLNGVRPERAGLSTEMATASSELARLKAQRGRVTAADHQASAEELPLLLMANLTGTDIATVLRWLVMAVVVCGDPAALILLAAVGSRRRGRREA
jgi:hypothetical protein